MAQTKESNDKVWTPVPWPPKKKNVFQKFMMWMRNALSRKSDEEDNVIIDEIGIDNIEVEDKQE